MKKGQIFDLAYEFRNSKLWKQIYEEELFAVKLPHDIAYCNIMGRNGDHMALAVYIGTKGFTSYRELTSMPDFGPPTSMADYLTQDCIQCSIEQRDLLSPEELKELKAYCTKAGISFRAPFPQFSRYYPYCLPWTVSSKEDWDAIGTALLVASKMSAVIKQSGKAALGLWPVSVDLNGEEFASEQLGFFENPPSEKVTIPLYSIVDGELVIERTSLPPYVEKPFSAPTCINEISVAKLKQKKQKGVFECDVIRLPQPVDGEPPYIPAMVMTVDERGNVLKPSIAKGPEYDPDELLNEFITNLGDAYPKTIKICSEEAKTLLEKFCKKANIRLTMTEEMDLLDEAVDSLMDHFEYDDDDDDDYEESDLEEMIAMLDMMTVGEIKMLPNMVLDQILDAADLFPPEIVKKVRKSRGK